MKTNRQVNIRTEEVLDQVSGVADQLYGRVKKIDFEAETFSQASVEDMRLHLGYTKNYTDLAKVRLQYLKYEDTKPE